MSYYLWSGPKPCSVMVNFHVLHSAPIFTLCCGFFPVCWECVYYRNFQEEEGKGWWLVWEATLHTNADSKVTFWVQIMPINVSIVVWIMVLLLLPSWVALVDGCCWLFLTPRADPQSKQSSWPGLCPSLVLTCACLLREQVLQLGSSTCL